LNQNLYAMAYGTIEYDEDGKPMCEICGKHFHRVIYHVRQKHDMNERDYKKEFGFDVKKGICSLESKDKSRKAVFDNYDKVVSNNLIEKGAKSRFKVGSQGRTKDMVSAQTKKMLIKRLETPQMKNAMRLSGEKVGLSGIGNKTRWEKYRQSKQS
jgi:hypothetical protein